MGSAGVGKTRFLEELTADARLQGFQIISGTCPSGGGSPLQPVVSALRNAQKEIRSIRSWVQDDDRPELARLFPELAPENAEEVPEDFRREDQSALFAALFSVFEALSRAKPLFLAIDDIQWADSSTLAFLGFAAERLADLPVLLCLAHRPFENGPQPDWMSASTPVELPPLGTEATEDLVASLFGTVDAP